MIDPDKMTFKPSTQTCRDLGYTQGTVTYTTTDPKTGKVVTDRGKWLTVRKKQADGSWKIVRDMANSDLPLSSASK